MPIDDLQGLRHWRDTSTTGNTAEVEWDLINYLLITPAYEPETKPIHRAELLHIVEPREAVILLRVVLQDLDAAEAALRRLQP